MSIRYLRILYVHATDRYVFQNVTWFPGYEAANAFVEMRHSQEPFLHLVHPRPAPWHNVVAPIAAELGVPLVPYQEWFAALQASISSGGADEVELMKANPALRFWRKVRTQCAVWDEAYLVRREEIVCAYNGLDRLDVSKN